MFIRNSPDSTLHLLISMDSPQQQEEATRNTSTELYLSPVLRRIRNARYDNVGQGQGQEIQDAHDGSIGPADQLHDQDEADYEDGHGSNATYKAEYHEHGQGGGEGQQDAWEESFRSLPVNFFFVSRISRWGTTCMSNEGHLGK